MFSALLALSSVFLLMTAALRDAATRVIPNVIPIALLAIGLCLRIVDGGLVSGLIIGIVLFGVMLVFWKLGYLGGGDVKLLAAFAFVIPASSIVTFLLAVTLAGGVLATIYLGLRLVVPRPAPGRRSGMVGRLLKAESWRISRHGSIPYAVAIAAGGLFVLLPGFAPLLSR